MASVADPLGLLRGLVADRLGPGRVAELVDQASVRVFGAFLLRRVGAVPRCEEYSPKVFTTRSGVDYFRPDGWVQVWLTQIDDDPDFTELREWPVAYHGTDSSKLGPILEAGLRKPGELPSVQMAHGNAGAGPDGAIYASPSLWLASHPVYSTLLDLGDGRWAQFVFKVRVRPGSYTEQACTLSNSKHWELGVRMDPNFPHNEKLEWLVASSSDVKVVGLMVREFGAGADPEVFGELAAQVAASPTEGPEYCWTANLREALRDANFTIDMGRLSVGTASVEWRVQEVESKQWQYRQGAVLRSQSFSLPDIGVEGGLELYFESGIWLTIARRHDRQEPVCFEWVEASSGLETSRIGLPNNDDWIRVKLAPCRPDANQIVFVARWISTRTTVTPISVSGSTAQWTLQTSLFSMRDWLAETVVISPKFELADVGGPVKVPCGFWFRPDKPRKGWCEASVFFTCVPQRPFAYTMQLGDKTVDFVHTPGGQGKVWAPWKRVGKGDAICMRLTITGPA